MSDLTDSTFSWKPLDQSSSLNASLVSSLLVAHTVEKDK